MKLSEFDYKFPEEQVAQFPLEDRTSARLMVINRATQTIEHKRFYEIKEYLEPGDALVLNDTKVIRARISGKKSTGCRVELLLIRELNQNLWDCLLKPARRIRPGTELLIADNINAKILGNEDGYFKVRFNVDDNIIFLLDKIGEVPLPAYIKRPPEKIDQQYYQTVYAEKEGSIAAPTAGLHFTKELIEEIETQGVSVVRLTLHIGPGTFLPVRQEDIRKHKMTAEYFEIDDEAKDKIENARRIIAVGTSSVRALESASRGRKIINQKGWTDLFIFPGYRFKIVDALITNFHLPKGTPLLLTAAFAGRDFLFRAYEEALRMRYRLFSYGDAMLIV